MDIQKFGKTNNKIGKKILEFCKKKILNYLSFFQKILKIKKKNNLKKFEKMKHEIMKICQNFKNEDLKKKYKFRYFG